jgi:SAM-dependent methyltransferase
MYDHAEAYEIAFSYRDFPAEVHALIAWTERHAGRTPASVLELAAGPADHAREFARRGIAATALDFSRPMCDYAARRAAEDGVAVDVVEGDMRNFDVGRRFDLIVLLLDSIGHLLTLDDAIANMKACTRHLAPGGVYIIDMAHPAETFAPASTTSYEWEADAPQGHAHMQWGRPDDKFDPISQVVDVSVRLDCARPGASND